MKIWASVATCSAVVLATSAAAAPLREAAFDWIEYREPPAGPAPQQGAYRNPILPGFYPDPSITRVGDDFYLINSTFSWFPGIPVWHSRDLVNWRQIGNAIDRPEQLDFAKLGMSRGVFAPAIAHDGKRFYIINTCVDCGGNFVITADNPAGPWSDPVWLPGVGGIDPSLFFDDDGRAWIVNNDEPPGGSRYEGHRAIWLHAFDPATLTTTGKPRLLVDGGVDITRKPIWIEGPHLFRHDGFYYLTAAEGGTSVDHSQVVFRAKTLDARFVPAPPSVNPILTQRDLDPARPSPVTSAGHADLVKLADGSWWAVFLATRPYEGNLYNTGRETYLLPVSWQDGWPVILPRGAAIPPVAPAPKLPSPANRVPPPGASPTVREEFNGTTLGQEWLSMRSAAQPRYRLANGTLRLVPGEGIGAGGYPAFVARRQRQPRGSVSTALRYVPARGEAAGIAAVQDDNSFLTLAVAEHEGRQRVELRRRAGASDPQRGTLVAARDLPATGGSRNQQPVRLSLDYDGPVYTARYAVGAGKWQPLGEADGTNLSSDRAGGFTGTMIGPFASK